MDGHLDSQDLSRQIGGIDDGADDVEAVSEADVGRVGGGVAVASERGVWIKVEQVAFYRINIPNKVKQINIEE